MADEGDILRRFGNRLRSLRREQGLSQEALAGLCGLDRTYIGGIERGERNISLRNIQIVGKALDVSISELMKGL